MLQQQKLCVQKQMLMPLQVQHTCMRSEGTTPTDGKDHLDYEQMQTFLDELRKKVLFLCKYVRLEY